MTGTPWAVMPGVPWVVRARVGQLHIGASYLEAVRHFIAACPEGAWTMMPRAVRMQYVRWIIAEVDENRRFYAGVMGARI